MDNAISHVDIAVFAYQEAENIATVIGDLADQDIFAAAGVDARVWILANGCTDATVPNAEQAVGALAPELAARFVVKDLPEPGKSRTLNRFIHQIARSDVGLFVFMDADIRLVETNTLSEMCGAFEARPELRVFSSRPVKDIDHFDLDVGIIARLISAGAGGLSDPRKAICGQLYAMRAEVAQRINVPIGLPVEDGFVRAMAVTDFLKGEDDLNRIDGAEEIFHVYESIRTIPELIRHQTRLVVGGAINAVLYGKIAAEAQTIEAAESYLKDVSNDEGWLGKVLQEELPRAPFGYVPFHFWILRLKRARLSKLTSPRAVLVLILGFALDSIAYVLATLRMARNQAAGHW